MDLRRVIKKKEQEQAKEKQKAYICLNCTRPTCNGDTKCFRDEMKRRQQEEKDRKHAAE